MKLHDPDTEEELIQIAWKVAGPAGFENPGWGFWAHLFRKIMIAVAVIYVVSIVLALLADQAQNTTLQHAIYAFLLMALTQHGAGRVAMAFQSACFFGTLANLPIRGRAALTHVRGIIFRRFWFFSLIGPFLAAILLHDAGDPAQFLDILTTWVLLSAIVWATLGIAQVAWVHRLRVVKIWQGGAWLLLVHIVFLHLFRGREILLKEWMAMIDGLIGSVLWIFPPAWAFPEMAARGGLIPATIWILWGIWSWLRWPSTAFPGYDRPHDFIGAFGDVGTAEENEGEHAESECPPEPGEDLLAPLPEPPSSGWVERLIAATLPASDRAAAGAFLPETRHTRTVNLCIVFAAAWLLVPSFLENLSQRAPQSDFLLLAVWIVPVLVFVLALLPMGNPLKAALLPCAVGNTPVPLFATLPVTLRSVLRITLCIVAIRTLIAVAIATPFFWVLAKILGLEDVGTGVIAIIPALGVLWIISVPALLANRLDPHLSRRKGIFPLILATSLVQVPIGFLWIIGGIAGVVTAATWGFANEVGRYAFLLLPAAIGCFALSAVMSWLIFEILNLSLRQRRYDWKTKKTN